MKRNTVIVSRPSLQPGGAQTTGYFEAQIAVEDVDFNDNSVKVTIESQWMKADDLRDAAEFFKQMADALEAK